MTTTLFSQTLKRLRLTKSKRNLKKSALRSNSNNRRKTIQETGIRTGLMRIRKTGPFLFLKSLDFDKKV